MEHSIINSHWCLIVLYVKHFFFQVAIHKSQYNIKQATRIGLNHLNPSDRQTYRQVCTKIPAFWTQSLCIPYNFALNKHPLFLQTALTERSLNGSTLCSLSGANGLFVYVYVDYFVFKTLRCSFTARYTFCCPTVHFCSLAVIG